MPDKRPPQTAKESKGFRNRLKKRFGRASQSTPSSRSNSPPLVVAAPAVLASPSTIVAPPAVAVPSADLLPPDVSIITASHLTPAEPTMTTDPELEEAANLRAKYTHFRILVIGRANAGKTTLLRRVCNTEEDPVYSEVRYLLPLIPHSRHLFPDRLTPPQKCELRDPCALL